MKRVLSLVLALATLASLAWVVPPFVILRPFSPQTPAGVTIAHSLRAWGGPLTLFLLGLGFVVALLLAPRLASWKGRALMTAALLVLSGLAGVARWNHFEWMFQPLRRPEFVAADRASEMAAVADDDLVLAVSVGADSHAYPVRAMAYHHLVNDVIGSEPIVATYCTLCHTGLVWRSVAAGRRLSFRLAGINNQNMLMSDEETGTWWQQVTGCAIAGPLAGQCLEPIAWDEVTFAVWRREHPAAVVLRPDEQLKPRYASKEWEDHVGKLPTVVPVDPNDGLKPRDLVVGVALGSAATAYPWEAIVQGNPIVDAVGGSPLLILLHPDGRSLRCFDRRIEGRTLELVVKKGTDPPVSIDSGTGSEWDFSGLSTAGPLKGRRLSRVACLKDYWFDWKSHHPSTGVFMRAN